MALRGCLRFAGVVPRLLWNNSVPFRTFVPGGRSSVSIFVNTQQGCKRAWKSNSLSGYEVDTCMTCCWSCFLRFLRHRVPAPPVQHTTTEHRCELRAAEAAPGGPESGGHRCPGALGAPGVRFHPRFCERALLVPPSTPHSWPRDNTDPLLYY